jgi:AraC-binding-like domain
MLISTDAVAERARLEYWGEIVCKTFREADFERPREGCNFYGSIDVDDRGPIRVGRIQAAAQSVLRPPGRVAQSSHELFFLVLQLRGRGNHRQAGRGGALEPGEFALVDTTRPYDLLFPDAFSQLVLSLPRDMLVSRLPDAQRLTACTVGARVGTGRVASVFIRQLALQMASVDAESLPRLQASLLDLVTTALGEQRNADASRSARYRRSAGRGAQFEHHHQLAHLGQLELRFGIHSRHWPARLHSQHQPGGWHLS